MAESITIIGNVGSDPHHLVTAGGVSITKFRVGCTRRVFDEASKSWIDKYTNWYQVSTFRQVAEHARESIKIGDAVIVTGRIVQRQWEANGRTGVSIDLEADTVGHDLRWGTAQWTRRSKGAADTSAPGRDFEPALAQTAAAPVDEQGWSMPVASDPEPVAAPF